MKVLIVDENDFVAENIKNMTDLKKVNHCSFSYFKSGDSLDNLKKLCFNIETLIYCSPLIEDSESKEINTSISQTIIKYLKSAFLSISIVHLVPKMFGPNNSNFKRVNRETEDLFARYCYDYDTSYIKLTCENVFGKWVDPLAKTIVGSLCYRISHNIQVSTKEREDTTIYEFQYIGTVINRMLNAVINYNKDYKDFQAENKNTYSINEMVTMIENFNNFNFTNDNPCLFTPFLSQLYSTYMLYTPYFERKRSLPCVRTPFGNLLSVSKSLIGIDYSLVVINPFKSYGGYYFQNSCIRIIFLSGQGKLITRNVGETLTRKYVILRSQKYLEFNIVPGTIFLVKNVSRLKMTLLIWKSTSVKEDDRVMEKL